jgi:peptide/nickel transport system substrate-binding protein
VLSAQNPLQVHAPVNESNRIANRRQVLQGSAAAIAGAMVLGDLALSDRAAAQEPVQGGTLIVAFEADPEILDPHNTTALVASRVLTLMHDNLVSRGYDGTIQPGLAETWEISADGLTYTFNLKQGVTFHSGKALTAADVKYTFERWKGNESSPTAYTIDAIETIDTPDDFTVVITLSQPYNIFLDQLAGAWSVILNQEVVDQAGDQYGVSVVDGTGPFKFASWSRNQSIVLERHDAYTWGSPIFQNPGPAYLDGIEIRIIPEDATRIAEFQSENVHIVMDVPAQDVERLTDASRVTVVQYAQLQTTYMGLNGVKTPTDDIAVRRALNYAINREEIALGAYFGLATPAYTFLHPETPYFWPDALAAAPVYDPEQSVTILEEGGWVLGDDDIREKDGVKLSIPFWVINNSETVLMAQIIEQQLAQIGVKVETVQYEQTAWFEAARSGDQVAYTIGVFYENADNLYFNFYSGQMPAPNRFSYNVPEVDAWLEDSRSNPDQAAVTQAYYNVQQRLIEDAVCVPLLHALGTVGVASDVQGLQVHPSRWLYRMLDLSLAN